MNPSRGKTIFWIVSLASLIASTLALFKISSAAGALSDTGLAISVMASFNITVLFAWLWAGAPAGIAALFVSTLLVLWANARIGFQWHIRSAALLQFMLTSIAANACLKHSHKIEGRYNIKSEKLNEEVNVLANEIRTKRADMSSLEKKMARYSNLKEVAESLAAVLSLDEITNTILEKAQKVTGKNGRTLLFLVDPSRQELMLTASMEAPGVKEKKGDAFDRWVLRNRKSLIVEDIANDFRFSADEIDMSKKIFRSLIETPLVTDNKIVGVIRMDSVLERAYTQDDLRLLDIIAGLGARSIQNAFLYSRAQELAMKDGLTGLVVRRYFMERFREETRRAAMNEDALSLVLMDIDHFKDYNDKYGHAAGDIVLKHLARTIGAILDGEGIAVRYGGEEMAVLLCGKGKKDAAAIAEKIRRTVKESPLTLRRHDAKITISIGLSSYPEDAAVEDELIRIADERLYKAKRSGRDRVVSS